MTDKCELQEEHVGICKGTTKRWFRIVCVRSFLCIIFSVLCVDGGWGRSFGAGWQMMLENNMENNTAKDAMS
jgi:hypothetical protein